MDKLNVGQTVLHLRFCSFSNVPKYYFGEPAQKFGMHTFHGKPDSISTKKKWSLRRKTSHHSRHPPPLSAAGGGGRWTFNQILKIWLEGTWQDLNF